MTLHTLTERFFSFFPTPRYLRMPAVGVDISGRSIKYMKLSRKGREVRPVFWGKLEVPKGVIESGRVVNHDELSRLLGSIRNSTKTLFAHVSLPEEHGYLFQTSVSRKKARKDIYQEIERSLRENVPIAPELAVFDYTPVPHTHPVPRKSIFEEDTIEPATDKEDALTASVSAYPSDVIEEYMEAFRRASLTPLSFEVEGQASARAVILSGDNGTYMIIDIGRSKAGLFIVNRGVVVFTATLEVGGDNLTSAIQKNFSVSYEEAERMKNTRGFTKTRDNTELFTTLFTTMSVFRDEIKKHYTFWEGEQKQKTSFDAVERIILCGGNANLAGLPEYLESNIGIPVERANVWANVLSFDATIPDIDYRHSLEYSTAIGLALRYTQK